MSSADHPGAANDAAALRLTETRAAELRESEARFRFLFENAPDAIFVHDVNRACIVNYNPRLVQLFECTADDLREHRMGMFSPPTQPDGRASNDAANEYIRRVLGGETASYEWVYRTAKGRLIHCEVQLALLPSSTRRLLRGSVIDITARKSAEAALRDSEEKFRGVFDHSPVIICLLTVPDGIVVEANSAAEAAFGFKRDEIRGKSSVELDVWAEPAERDRFLRRLVAEGSLAALETRMRRRDGSEFTALFSASLISIGGRPYSLNLLQDISARKEAERTREHLLALTKATLESTADGILVTTSDGRIQNYNRIFVEMWQVSEAVLAAGDHQSAARTVLDQLAVSEKFLEKIRALYAQPFAESFDTLHLKDGRVFERFSRPQLVQGEAVGRVWSFRDVTARVRTEATLRENQAQLLEATRIARLGYWEYDVLQDQFLFNDQFYSLLRTTAQHEGGYTMSSAHYASRFVHPDDAAIVGVEIGKALSTTDPNYSSEIDHRVIFADGAIGYITVHIRVEKDAEGRTIRTHGANADITERKLAAAELARLEESLRESQKLEALGTLAGGIAHDFNNILTAMFGFLELTRHDLPATHPAQEWLRQILASGQRAKDLVRQILAFSRHQLGERVSQRLDPVVAEVVNLLRSTVPAGVEFATRFDPTCPPVLADATQIHQIVMNLGTNAWHALPERGGRISITLESAPVPSDVGRTHPKLAGAAAVCLTVADNGSGIEPAVLPRIFEPFFTTKEVGKGTGLGLAVVHGLVAAHEGAITVNSVRGGGTTFRLFFPALASPPPLAAPAAPAPPPGKGQHILWIDDDPATSLAVEKTLTSLGYRVTACRRAAEGMEKFCAMPSTFNLVLTDLAMPEMSGDEIVAALSRIAPQTPMLVITGFIEPRTKTELLARGVREVLHKPLTREELATAIARHLLPA